MTSINAESLYRSKLGLAEGKSLSDVGEKKLLGEYLLPICRAVCGDQGLGDDAATLTVPAGNDIVVTTDRAPSDLLPRQFGLMSSMEFGAYVVRVNVSDLAAMGAVPLGIVLTCAFPPDEKLIHVLQFMWGAYTEGADLGCPVVGGDTKASVEESVSASAVGAVPTGRSVRRGPIKPGMSVYLSGPVGHAGVALRWFAHKTYNERSRLDTDLESLDQEFREYLVRPRPRIDLARSLSESGTQCAMDITDGLGQTLAEIATQSNVNIEIDFDSLIIRPSIIRAAELLGLDMHNVLGGIGIDLELVAVGWENPSSKDFYPIGRVVDGPGEVSFQGWGPMPRGGFEHFTMKPRDYLRLFRHGSEAPPGYCDVPILMAVRCSTAVVGV